MQFGAWSAKRSTKKKESIRAGSNIVKTYRPIVVVLGLASLAVQTPLAKTYAKRESVAALEGRIAETSNSLVVRITMVEQKIADLPSERDLQSCSWIYPIYAVSYAPSDRSGPVAAA